MLITLRSAWRDLRRAPSLTILIVGMLAAGIGAATAMFSLASVLLLRPVAGVADPARVISVERTGGAGVIDIFSYPDYRDLRDRVSPAADLAAFRRTSFDVRAEASERVSGALVSGNYFGVLGVRARMGRTLADTDANASLAVVSDACWRRLLGSDPDAIGRTLVINGHPFTIVGVLSPAFTGTYSGQFDDVWVPFAAQPIVMPRMSAGVLANRNSRWVQIMGRLRARTPAAAAANRLAAAGNALANAFPGDHAAGRLTLRPGLGLASDERVEIRRLLSLLSAAAMLLLFIGCGNAGNLLLARAHVRRREIAIRRALGASAARIGAGLLAEGAILAMASGAIGLWIAPTAMSWLTPLWTSGYGVRPETLVVDWRACAFALAISSLVTLVFTLLPLQHVRSARASHALRAGGRGDSQRRTRLRSSLVALQVAFSVVLAAGAGLSLRTMAKIDAVKPGYATSGRVTTTFALDLHGYSPVRAADFFAALAGALRSDPEVRAVSWATAVPPVLYGGRRSVFRPGEAPSQAQLQKQEETLGLRAALVVAGPEFFASMDIPMRRGRGFTDRDRAGAQAVAVISRTLAERLWPGQDAIGRFLEAPPYSGAVPPPMQVVGVAEDTRHQSLLSNRAVPVLYLPFLQNPDTRATVVVQTAAAAATVAPLMRRAAAAIDPDVPPIAVQDIADYDAATLWEQRSIAAAFGFFAVCGLVLAAIGVYAALAHDVASRRRELAVRVALGAPAGGISALVVRDAVRVALVGAAAGTALSLGLSGRLQDVLFGVGPRDPLTFVSAPLALVLVAALASAVPARRAAHANPLEALALE